MNPHQLTVEIENPLIEIEVKGSLSVKGSDLLEVSVKTNQTEETELIQDGDTIRLTSPGECKLRVPRQARLRISSLESGTIKAVDGDLEIVEANGPLNLRNVGSTVVKRVKGNLQAKNIFGDFKAEEIHGNLVVRDVQGSCMMGSVSGNLVLDDVDGSVTAKTKGNATMHIDPAPGAVYEVEAQGNLTCSLPMDASAEVEIRKASKIMVNLMDAVDIPSPEAPCSFTLLDGDSKLIFSAVGNVHLNSQSPDWNYMPDFTIGEEVGETAAAFADQITSQIDLQMQNIEQQLNSHLADLSVSLGSAGFSSEQIDKFHQRAQEAGERASERAQEKLRQAQERLEKKLEQAQRTAERQARNAEVRARAMERRAQRFDRRRRFRVGDKEIDLHPHEPVSEEERLFILKMLQDKKISLDEAESLLGALEGKGR